ncbi:PREDICTED: calmodulin-binding protein 60 D-like [Nicotiana attenuata]|uniref:Calmodulin-binding protein 60 d n=1 Tax=Nicotiana attenuata TaxID=49451 RepID=A0A1J6IRX1_NICAT|nr:PREDICTED: calmodulin-binding protein 60 D-like [Nicotiana attenuata]OIT07582.1 calmodulin-binding protein 60 d [Nicotiana attenuata]
MVQKRNINRDSDGGSEFSARESKRQHPCTPLFTGLRSYSSPQELALRLEPSIRKWVRDEIERTLQLTLRSSPNEEETTQSRAIHLHFDDILPSTLFTGSKVENVDNRPIKVVLHDASSNQRITSGPISSVKVSVVVLNGEFNPNDREDWTEEEFSRKIVREREGKRPLLTGDLIIQLRDGVGHLGDISFTDNSSWIKSRTFRLGLKLINRSGELRVREGVSEPFTVKDHRGEAYKKHYPPALGDEIWRLEKIAKAGASHKRLSQKGISCVKDFLRLYVTDPSLLREVLACGTTNNTWEKITEHANTCVLDNSEWYIYNAGESIVLLFNCIYKLVGAILDGQNCQSLDKLDVFQKRMVEDFKRRAYKNLDHLVLLEDHSFIGQAVLASDLRIGFSHIPSSSQQNMNYRVEQGQVELQSNSDCTTISPSLAYIVQQDSPTAVSMPESFHGMQAFNSTLASSFLISDPCCSIYPGDYDWGSSGSIESLGMTDFLPPNNNYQLGTPALPGNGLFASSSIQPVSPNLGFHIARRGNPRAIWCTIRAVLKWKTLVKRKCVKMGRLLHVDI